MDMKKAMAATPKSEDKGVGLLPQVDLEKVSIGQGVAKDLDATGAAQLKEVIYRKEGK